MYLHYLFLCLQPTHLANFNQVQSIQYSSLEEKDRKGMLQLNVAGAAEVNSHMHTPCILFLKYLICMIVLYEKLSDYFKCELL